MAWQWTLYSNRRGEGGCGRQHVLIVALTLSEISQTETSVSAAACSAINQRLTLYTLTQLCTEYDAKLSRFSEYQTQSKS